MPSCGLAWSGLGVRQVEATNLAQAGGPERLYFMRDASKFGRQEFVPAMFWS